MRTRIGDKENIEKVREGRRFLSTVVREDGSTGGDATVDDKERDKVTGCRSMTERDIV